MMTLFYIFHFLSMGLSLFGYVFVMRSNVGRQPTLFGWESSQTQIITMSPAEEAHTQKARVNIWYIKHITSII